MNAHRSSVKRDFLNAHFQAHVLQRDWLPQPSSSLSRSSSSADHAAAVENREMPPKNKVLFVTAIYGDYEKTLKEPARQQHHADFVAFTDREDLSSPTWQIRLVKDPLEYLLKHGGRVGVGANVSSVAADVVVGSTEAASRGHAITETLSPAIDGTNSLTQNRHPFNLAKVFKMQFYRFFDLTEYRAAVWLDGTVRVISPEASAIVYRLLEDEGRNLVTFEHARGGLLSEEVAASKFNRYESTHWGCCDQPFQNVTRQYEDYLQQGFVEKWWLEEYDAPLGISKRPQWGLWVTCFVAFDLRSPITFEFLDAWWRENVMHSTQDQVSFPYLAWKMKVYPFSLPSSDISVGSADLNDLYEKGGHRLRRNRYAL